MKRRAPSDVLIVKFQALGDVLRTTSLLEPLVRRGHRVWWLTKPDARALLKGNPHLEGTFVADPDDEASIARMAERLAGRFDRVLSLEEHPAVARVARAACRGELTGVTLENGRLGYTPSSAPWYGMSLLNRDADGTLATANALKAANRLSYASLWLNILGLKPGAKKPGPVLRLPARRRKTRTLAFNFGAGARWPAKQVSEEEAARLLVAVGRAFRRPLLLLGGKDEAVRNRRIAALATRLEPGIRPIAAPTLPLRSFAALLGTCASLVTTDSLALHVAAALGVPAVALVGPTSAAELDFHGRGVALKPPTGCSCFYAARCSRPSPCLDDIAETAVVAALRRCLR